MFKITKNELVLAITLAIGGFIFSSREFIVWLNHFNPLYGFTVYYIILYASLFVLSKFNLVIFGIKIKKPMQTLGLLLITFSFFLIVNWESCYVQTVLSGSCANVSNIYFGSEDGMTWWFWTTYVGITSVDLARLLTFVFTPFILTIIGGLLVDEKVKILS
jgi:hypothetical protein